MLIVKREYYSKKAIAHDVVKIALTFAFTAIATVIGIFVVAAALPFAKESGPTLPSGWRMKNLPAWAWPWDNAHDGCYGDKRGDYQKTAGTGLWAQYNWLVFRNSFNRGDREIVGFNFAKTVVLSWTGSIPDAQMGGTGWTYFRAHLANGKCYPGIIYNRGRLTLAAGWKIHATKAADAMDVGFVFRPQFRK